MPQDSGYDPASLAEMVRKVRRELGPDAPEDEVKRLAMQRLRNDAENPPPAPADALARASQRIVPPPTSPLAARGGKVKAADGGKVEAPKEKTGTAEPPPKKGAVGAMRPKPEKKKGAARGGEVRSTSEQPMKAKKGGRTVKGMVRTKANLGGALALAGMLKGGKKAEEPEEEKFESKEIGGEVKAEDKRVKAFGGGLAGVFKTRAAQRQPQSLSALSSKVTPVGAPTPMTPGSKVSPVGKVVKMLRGSPTRRSLFSRFR